MQEVPPNNVPGSSGANAPSQLAFYRYYQRREGESPWFKAADSDLGRIIEAEHPPFVTVLATTYDPDDSATHENPLYRGDLYVDFDVQDPDVQEAAEAVSAALRFIKKLEGLGVDPQCLDVALSGGKGAHIIVPQAAYLPQGQIGHGFPALPLIFRAMVEDVALYADSLDTRVYTCKRGRQWRQAGVRRKNGRYKVPVTLGELKAAQAQNEYVRLTSAPREPIPRREARFAPALADLFNSKRAEIENRQKEAAEKKAKREKQIISDEDAALEVKRVLSALAVIDADEVDYGTWFRIGAALHSTRWANGLEMWEDWSAKRSHRHRNTAEDCETAWRSLTGTGKTANLGTLVMYAKERGWVDPCPRRPKRFEVRDGWLYRVFQKSDTGDLKVCSEVRAVMECRNEDSEDWGTLLEFKDVDGWLHRVHVPHAHIMTDFTKNVLAVLAGKGLRFNIAAGESKVRDAFKLFLLGGSESECRGIIVSKGGWHGDTYVMNGRVISPSGASSDKIFLDDNSKSGGYKESGSLEEWRQGIARYAIGNSRLAFALSAALAAPLLRLVGMDGGGFNLRGGSSIGKSTLLRAAASVWGPPEFVHRWRATDNGLEAIALRHNDNLLLLDEVSEIDPKKLEAALYMLSNGGGKVRMRKEGGTRDTALWRVLMLSSGEESTAAALAQIGNDIKVGADIRLADLVADAGKGAGVFEQLHNHAPGALADAIKGATEKAYGTAGPAFLVELCKNLASHREHVIRNARDLSATLAPMGCEGQVSRVADRFALVGIAGELATQLGILPWPAGEAKGAAEVCFKGWLDGRSSGKGNAEGRRLLEHVAAFFSSSWMSRFLEVKGARPVQGDRPLSNLVGYREDVVGDGEVWWFKVPAPNLKAVLGPFAADQRRALEALASAGWLLKDDAKGKLYHRGRLPGGYNGNYYVFTVPAEA